MYNLHTQKEIKYEDLLEFLVQHICETLFLNETLQILNYIYSVTIIKDDSFEFLVKDYFIKNSITIKIHKQSMTCILLCNESIPDSASIFTFNNIDNKWSEAEPEDKNEILLNEDIRNAWIINKNNLNKIIGFISTDNKNKNKVFKTKDISIKRNSGARCDEAGKTKTIKLLNDIVGTEWLTKENTKKLVQIDLCIIEEIFLRYLNKNKSDKKIWFLNSNIAVFNKI